MAWNHNTHYHERLLAARPGACHRALDIGCGPGLFARRLAAAGSDRVDALDRDARVVAEARALSAGVANLRFIEADFMTWSGTDRYDFISMIAVLHHLPFDEALSRAAELLRPGGVLAVLGIARERSLAHEAARGIVALPLSGFHRLLHGVAPVGAEVAEPAMTLRDIRRRAGVLLPRAVIRQHVLWRYSIIWTKTELPAS